MKHPTDEEIEKFASDVIPLMSEQKGMAYKRGIIKGAKWVRDQQPKLKTLEDWGWDNKRPLIFACVTPLGEYFVGYITGDLYDPAYGYWWAIGTGEWKPCQTIQEGMRNCQADYEERAAKRVNELYV